MSRSAALAVLASAAGAQLRDPFTLDPKTYRSPSGEYSLRVDPSQRSGAGSGRYRFTYQGEELWSGTRPWTLMEADVTDDGLVAGFACAAGMEGGDGDALTIVLLDRSGEARLEERTEREGIQSCGGGPEPMVNGLFIDRANDRLVVRIDGDWGKLDAHSPESWWTYALSTGAAGARFSPRRQLGANERLLAIRAARPVPGTGLVLLDWAWLDSRARQYGSVFMLQDRDGEVRWRLDWPSDCAMKGDRSKQDRLWEELRWQGALLAVEDSHFTVRQAVKNERVTFEVRRAMGSSGWEVRESGRAPYEQGAVRQAAAGDASSGPPLELEHLGTIVLGAENATSPIHDTLGVVSRLAVGPGDRLYAVDRRTGCVHVFDAAGERQLVCRPSPSDFEEELVIPSLTVNDAGEIFLGDFLADELRSQYVRFGADGERRGIERLQVDSISQEWYAQPGTDRMWVVGYESVFLVGANERVVRSIVRAPDDTWLRATGAAAVAPDGSLALITGSSSDRTAFRLHVFTASGEPVLSLDLPPSTSNWPPIAFDGERVVFTLHDPYSRGSSVVSLDLGTGRCRRVALPRSDVHWRPAFAAGAQELWLFDGERRVERYRPE